jgi:ribosomal protein S24E
MKTEIIKQKKNPFLGREEITIKVYSETTPTKEELKAETGKNPELTIIKRVESNFGRQEYIVEIQVYESAEARAKYEVIPKKIRAKMEKEKKEAEAAEKKRLADEKAAAEAAKEAAKVEAETSKEPAEKATVEETKEEEKTE